MQTKTGQNCYYITTPIYYANGHPHLGNTYSTALADTLTRFHRYLGHEAFFLTGTDEHGDKVHQAAVQAGKSAQQFTDEVSEQFKDAWKELGLDYSRFIRTTEAEHKKVVRDILTKIHQQGDIYFGEYSGLYCVGCERFLTDKELEDGKCPDHKTVPQVVKEQNYFFRMSKYQSQLLKHIDENPDFIRPERYKNEVLAMLREPLEDLCISRPKTRLTWGIELPFDPNYVTYVWFDALINYLTGIGYPDGKDFKKFWPVAEHLIAKDIVKPHGVFWPTMLFAMGVPVYKHLNVHGYWVTPTGKMSKSLGNVVNPIEVKRRFGMDVFRYFVFREMAFGLDCAFSGDSLATRYNADLANNLGNFVSRSLAMVEKYRGGVAPKPGKTDQLDDEFKVQANTSVQAVLDHMSRMEINRALEAAWAFIDAGNVYIDRTKPWSIAKAEKTDPKAKERLDTVLYYQLEGMRVIASFLTAFMPETSAKVFKALGYDDAGIKAEQRVESSLEWGRLKPGAQVTKGEALFPRIEFEIEEVKPLKGKKMEASAEAGKTEAVQAPKSDGTSLISYDDFSKVELRVGQILEAIKIEKSDKLIKLQVDLGEAAPRQIVAGIGKHYAADTLVGRKVAVVANLKPAKLMGQESNGMILAASDDQGNLEIVAIPPGMTAGAKIK